MKDFIERNYLWLVGLIFIIFLALRLGGVTIPYHQDEYKWPLYAEEKVFAPGSIPHPPLTEFIYRIVGQKIGLDNFRLIPLTFSIANFFLLAYLSKIIFDKRTSLISLLLFSISYFSVLASLMVDVDGAVMVFFLLLMMTGYMKLRAGSFDFKGGDWKWLVVLVVAAILGFLVKVSFFIGISAVILDFAIEKRFFDNKKRLIKFGLYTLGVIAFLTVVLLGVKFIFPYFDLSKALKYWEHFARFKDRGWLQILIQGVKSLFYLSPLLILPPLFSNKETINKLRPFSLFVVIGLVFYFILFDFSVGALDRYLAFLIVPLVILSAKVFDQFVGNGEKIKKSDLVFVVVSSVLVFAIQFANHFVPYVYPKTDWINRVFDLKWNFLYPFSGGSGPLPFYVSFLFIGIIWGVCLLFVLVAKIDKGFIKRSLFIVAFLGILYNFVFIEEYQVGKINGSARFLVDDLSSYIKSNKNIKDVLVYNDNGGFNIYRMGKYERRIYAVPDFADTYIPIFQKFQGHIMLVNIPRFNPESLYGNYFASCEIVYEKESVYIGAAVLNCGK